MEAQSSFSTCAHRTRLLACKLALNPSSLTKYSDILADQEHHSFIERVQDPVSTTRCHYIPLHAVYKDSPTTPVHIVYDCSCHHARNQPSLNDCLLTGQPQLNDLMYHFQIYILLESAQTLRGPFYTYSSMKMIETTPDSSG